ncbi:MAG: hypothetical protein IJ800_04870 [Clostridia bacterium]|nr:hypothetical protein [Clostridia bacterium]
MSKLQKYLDFLIEKYEVETKGILSDDGKKVSVDGKEYPLLPWRNERRFIELKKICETTVGEISHFKIMSVNSKSISLSDVIKKEIDLVEYIGASKITKVFEAKNGETCSIICETEKGWVATLELACSLPSKTKTVDKHEIITDRGTACDRGVDSQTPLYSTYVYGGEEKTFTDVDFELYGLTAEEISVVRQAFEITKNGKIGEENIQSDARLEKLLNCIEKSEKTCEDVRV